LARCTFLTDQLPKPNSEVMHQVLTTKFRALQSSYDAIFETPAELLHSGALAFSFAGAYIVHLVTPSCTFAPCHGQCHEIQTCALLLLMLLNASIPDDLTEIFWLSSSSSQHDERRAAPTWPSGAIHLPTPTYWASPSTHLNV